MVMREAAGAASDSRGGDPAHRPAALGRQATARVPEPRLSAAAGTCCVQLGGSSFLFSAAHQELFALNETAAYVWRAVVADGLSRRDVRAELVASGVSPEAADAVLEAALAEWLRRGLIASVPEPASGAGADGSALRQDIRLAGKIVRIRHAPELAARIAPLFRHLEVPPSPPDVTLDVVGRDGGFAIFRAGRQVSTCAGDEAATTLKGVLLECVLETAGYALALHAAALVRHGRMLLLTGPPGAGKTTLALALAAAGFELAGDDVVLLDGAGRATALPFPAAVKAGAWEMVAGFRPDIRAAPVWRRPDRRRVRYLAPQHAAPAAACPVGWVVQLDRRPSAEPVLASADDALAIGWLLREAQAPNRTLTTAGFQAVCGALRGAASYRLAYARLPDAVALLDQACR